MEREHVLLFDVDPGHARALRELGRPLELDVVQATSDGKAMPRERPPALLVVALDRSAGDAVLRLRDVTKSCPPAPVVVLSRDLETDTVVRLLRSGVRDVIGLPVDTEELAARVLGFLDGLRRTEGAEALVGMTPAMRALRAEIDSIARAGSTVLIQGETGTGKGMVARYIHERSERPGPLVHVDCAALSHGLVESELFGHERGAFTGAVARRIGRFEQATNGTLFLDEIGDLELPLQAKLLRVLQDRQFERIGGDRTLTMNARVIAATHQDLRAMMRERTFRPDLYFRLRVIELQVPALRERKADLPLLVQASLEQLSTKLGRKPPQVAPDFLQALAAHDWPGNVRELVHLLERLLVRGGSARLEAADLEEALRPARRVQGEDAATEAPEHEEPHLGFLDPSEIADRACIAEVLRATAGNVSRAARRLGITRSRLRYRIAKYGLEHLIPDD